MLIGVHIGDSLGATLEFGPAITDPEKWLRTIQGGGRLNWQKGEATDDTDLTLLTLKSIINPHSFDIEYFKQGLIDYYDSYPKDIGVTTRKSILRLKRGLQPIQIDNEPNGSLMKCSPLALLDLPDEVLNNLIKNICSITHYDPLCIQLEQWFIKALKTAFKARYKEDVIEAIIEITKTNNDVYERITNIPNTHWEDLPTSGYVLDSFTASFWSLYHSNSFEEGIIKIINRGNDADTTGSIAGALLGAFYGLDQIPNHLIAPLHKKEELITVLNRRIYVSKD